MAKGIKYSILIFPVIWMALVPIVFHSSWTVATTVERLKLMELAIDKFRESYGRLPESISEIRSYLLAIGISFSPYDSFGMRIQYVPLSESEYFVKSFGSDQITNGPESEKDLTVVKMKSLNRIPASQINSGDRSMYIFPAPLLMGNRPDGKTYLARLVLEKVSHTKKLIVRGIRDGNFIMVAFHDSVQEFLWLGDGKTIVFTANGSTRYQDGIYIWDIASNTTTNIISKFQEMYFPEEKGKYYFALSRSDQKDNGIYFFAIPMNQVEINPEDYFRFSNLYKLIVKNENFDLNHYSDPNSIFEFNLDPQDQININPLSLEIQKDWKTLSISGDMTSTIVNWQNFCAKYNSTPVFPYCLFWLSSLYADASRNLASNHFKEAEIMFNYALEYSYLLDQQSNAPHYLRAFGTYLKTTLQSRNFPAYSISDLVLQQEVPQN